MQNGQTDTVNNGLNAWWNNRFAAGFSPDRRWGGKREDPARSGGGGGGAMAGEGEGEGEGGGGCGLPTTGNIFELDNDGIRLAVVPTILLLIVIKFSQSHTDG